MAWIIAASVLGFSISAVFSGWLKLSRRLFLVPYVALTGAFLYTFVLWNEIDLVALFARNWIWGVIAGLILGAFLVNNVRSQPASPRSTGGGLVLDLAWLGLVYGVIDALFLNVMPVAAVWNGFLQAGWTDSWLGMIAAGVLALGASLLVTAAYHVGYPEFRNKRVGLVLVGNALITLAYLLSTNPLGAVISHTAMHLAAVLRGPETTIQLPPHVGYQA
jgi:hypothetical protein